VAHRDCRVGGPVDSSQPPAHTRGQEPAGRTMSHSSHRVVARIEHLRGTHKWSANRIAFELAEEGVSISRRTISRHLLTLGLNRSQFIDPDGQIDREPQKIVAHRPGHMVHIDVKKTGRIPDGGGWRAHGRGSHRAKAAERSKRTTKRGGYVDLHSAIDGYTRLAYSEALPDGNGRHRNRIHAPCASLVRSPWHRPHRADRHRQRRVLPGRRLCAGTARVRGTNGSPRTRHAATGK
jgi:hypothetical protein